MKHDISNCIDTRLVTTTSIIAKLAVFGVLIAGITDARAAERPPHQAKAHSKLLKLERDWKRLHESGQRAMLGRLAACGEIGRCAGPARDPPAGRARIHAAAIDEDQGSTAAPPLGGTAPANP